VIAYDLRCLAEHRFEGWFASSADYERQNTDGLLLCPICGDGCISKAPSAPFIGRKGNQNSAPVPIQEPTPNAPVTNAVAVPDAAVEMFQKLVVMQQQVLKDSTYVGTDFAEEARAIHYGETDNRMIHGEASANEAEALQEEGICVAALLLPYIPPMAKN
jgi:hypothetical protein